MSGVELILAAITFPITVITAVDVFQRAGERLAARVDTYENAPGIIQDFSIFGHTLHKGSVTFDVDLIKWAYGHTESPQLRNSLDRGLENLKATLIRADNLLDRLLHKDGSIRKRKWLLHDAQRQIENCLEDLRAWQTVFTGTIDLIRQHNDLRPNITLLDASRYVEKSIQRNIVIGGEISGGQYFRIAAVELKTPNQLQPMSLIALIEPQIYNQAGHSRPARDRLSDISRRLAEPKSGLLRCLGYQIEPEAGLIFEVPSSRVLTESLWQHLDGGRSDVHSHMPLPSLSYKFELSKQLARSVMSIHASGIVHKNIRSDTIVLLKQATTGPTEADSNRFGHQNFLVLTQWAAARITTGVTVVDFSTQWAKDVYRHPARQDIQVDERYKMGHDIFSLGVCLLEIGLWETLVVNGDDGYRLSDKVVDAALRLGLLSEADRGRVDRCLEPTDLQTVLIDLAEIHLPSAMGAIYSEIVNSCLTSMEGGLGDIADFDDEALIGAKFNEVVIAALANIRI